MGLNENVEKLLSSGVEPIELSFEVVEYINSNKVILRSILNINSLELGRLTPAEYRVVAGRSKQGGELLARQIEKVFDAFPLIYEKYPTLECITIPILSRTLLEGAAASIIFEEFEKNASVSPSYIAFEISSDVLFEEMSSLSERFGEIRDLNVRIAVSELGDEFCPVFRLRELPYDFAFADKYSLELLEGDDERAKGLPSVVHLDRAKLFAVGIPTGHEKFAKHGEYDGYSTPESFITLGYTEEVSCDASE